METGQNRNLNRRRDLRFVPLRELLPWWDDSAKKKEAEKSARDDASDLIRITNQDLAQTRTELFFFLAAILFMAITTLSITDRDLLFGSRVLLPVLGLSMSFDAFLLGAPALLILGHYAMLLKFSRLRAKCVAINELIERTDGSDILALKTASNFMAQWLIASTGNTFFRGLSASIYLISMCLAPLLTLLLLTVRTLPLHRPVLTFIQVLCLSADAALLALFHWNGPRQKLSAAAIGSGAWLVVSLTFCIPDGLFDRVGRSVWAASVPFASADSQRTAFAPTAFLLENGLDTATGRPILFFSRNLIVTGDPGWRGPPTAAPQIPATPTQDRERTGPNLRGRDLRYAQLDRSNLHGADFTLTDLTGVSLDGADLRGAVFGCAAKDIDPLSTLWDFTIHRNERGYWAETEANCTVMAGINLSRADLRESKFQSAQWLQMPSLAGARLSGANLDQVDLSYVDLSLAALSGASMVGADLRGALLIGADLTSANLTGSNLTGAELRLAALGFARLDGARLVGARLVLADLTNASLIGAELGQAVLHGARFDRTVVWGATPPTKEFLAWADLNGAVIDKPEPVAIENMRASLARGGEKTRTPAAERLKALLEMNGGDPELTARNHAWNELVRVLKRDPEEPSFRAAVSQIINENACAVPEFARALAAWAKPDAGYGEYARIEREVPPAPTDPALSEGPNVKFAASDLAFSFYPDTTIPLPAWYDWEPLVQRLESGKCPASKSTGPDLTRALRSFSEFRK